MTTTSRGYGERWVVDCVGQATCASMVGRAIHHRRKLLIQSLFKNKYTAIEVTKYPELWMAWLQDIRMHKHSSRTKPRGKASQNLEITICAIYHRDSWSIVSHSNRLDWCRRNDRRLRLFTIHKSPRLRPCKCHDLATVHAKLGGGCRRGFVLTLRGLKEIARFRYCRSSRHKYGREHCNER